MVRVNSRAIVTEPEDSLVTQISGSSLGGDPQVSAGLLGHRLEGVDDDVANDLGERDGVDVANQRVGRIRLVNDHDVSRIVAFEVERADGRLGDLVDVERLPGPDPAGGIAADLKREFGGL